MSRIKRVKKTWGWEEWLVNTDLYCGKKIYNDGHWSSKGKFHYHPIKDETFYVLKGTLQIDIGLENGWTNSSMVKEGQTFRIKPTIKHRFRAIGKDCTFFEFSTKHMEEDSIRCYFDEENKKWIDVNVS